MPSTNPGFLNNYKDILVSHEEEYHSSRGSGRQEVLQEIIEEIGAQADEDLDEDDTKDLETVSRSISEIAPGISSICT